jgi:hypothetical protein
MKTRLATVLFVLLLLSAADAQQLRETLGKRVTTAARTPGELTLTVFSSGCRTEADRNAARERTGWFARFARCRLLREVTQPNYVPDAGLTHMGNVMRDTATMAHFHGFGTSNQATATSDTGCIAELTTQYSPNGTRATGTLGGTGATFSTVGVSVIDEAVTVQEFCLMTAATGGTIWSRILTGSVPIGAGQTITTTYTITVTRP